MNIKVFRVTDLFVGSVVEFIADFLVPDSDMPANVTYTIPAGTIGVVVRVVPEHELAVVKVSLPGKKNFRVLVYDTESSRSGSWQNRLGRLELVLL